MSARNVRNVASFGAGLTALVLSVGSAAGATGPAVRDGGTYRVGVYGDFFGSIDPALAGPAAQPFLSASCGGLVTTPDKPLPAAFNLIPEIATAYPKIANGGRTYTFRIRKGVRFSTGAPVTARSFAYTLNRLLSPVIGSPGASAFAGIVGAPDVVAGKTTSARGIVARRNMLTIRLREPAGNFLGNLASGAGGFCVVPEGLPLDPEGAKAPLPSAGPYFVSEYVPGERVTLERNRYYSGTRPHHVDRFVGDLTYVSADPAPALDRVESGELDSALVAITSDRAEDFKQRYGINRSRFFVKPGTFFRMFVLNTSGRLFRNNVELRQAVNFAVDRTALMREVSPFGGYLTDQYLAPVLPAFRNDRIYPLKGPDVARARALARGHLRSGKAVLYTQDGVINAAQAQILQRNLKAIGLDVEVRTFPGQLLFQKLATVGEPWDIGRIRFITGRPDPSFLNDLFDGRTVGQPNSINLSHFDSAKYNRLLDAAARLSVGPQRARVYGRLDVDMSRNPAPAVPLAWEYALTLVSARTGCVVANPFLDLTAVCLK
jgi:peptide/nickel transport system substrate-binding protein